MAKQAIIDHLGTPQMAVGHLRLAAIRDFYNVYIRNTLYLVVALNTVMLRSSGCSNSPNINHRIAFYDLFMLSYLNGRGPEFVEVCASRFTNVNQLLKSIVHVVGTKCVLLFWWHIGTQPLMCIYTTANHTCEKPKLENVGANNMYLDFKSFTFKFSLEKDLQYIKNKSKTENTCSVNKCRLS